MEFLIFMFLNYGIANIVVHGSIFNGFRRFWKDVSPSFFGTLFSCMICLPTWTGFITSYLFQYLGYSNLSPLTSVGVDNIYLSTFLDGCLTSGVVFIIHVIEEWFELNRPD
tara:strand:+ start:291 stop:623 length:333 start_codon:yes stop_codon:yes gene_type:complete